MSPIIVNKSTEFPTVTLPKTPAESPKGTAPYRFSRWFRAVTLPFRLAWGALLVGVGVLAALLGAGVILAFAVAYAVVASIAAIGDGVSNVAFRLTHGGKTRSEVTRERLAAIRSARRVQP